MRYLEKQLIKILKENWGEFVGSRELASRLGVSKSLICRLISRLRAEGIPIVVDRKQGYALIDGDNLSELPRYLNYFNTKISFKPIYIEFCPKSSQDIAIEYENVYGEGLLIICEEMRGGRGRLGRSWIAPRGGLWFTLLLRPEKTIPHLHILSLCIGVAVAKAIRDILEIDVELKWPNDVVYNDKKVCGILIEASAEADRVKRLLIGVGVNVNNSIPEELRAIAISLSEILNHRIPRIPLLLSILLKFDRLYEMLLKNSKKLIVDEWQKLSSTIGRDVIVVLTDGSIVKGRAIGVDEEGRLILKTTQDRVVYVEAGDVVHLRKSML